MTSVGISSISNYTTLRGGSNFYMITLYIIY